MPNTSLPTAQELDQLMAERQLWRRMFVSSLAPKLLVCLALVVICAASLIWLASDVPEYVRHLEPAIGFALVCACCLVTLAAVLLLQLAELPYPTLTSLRENEVMKDMLTVWVKSFGSVNASDARLEANPA